MRVEVWSDVVCPWCYIGKRRIENALAAFDHADEVEVHWRSYQLDPGAPTEPTERAVEMIARKYGRPEEVAVALLAGAGLIGGRDPAVDGGTLSQLNVPGFGARKPLCRLGRMSSNSVYTSIGTEPHAQTPCSDR